MPANCYSQSPKEETAGDKEASDKEAAEESSFGFGDMIITDKPSDPDTLGKSNDGAKTDTDEDDLFEIPQARRQRILKKFDISELDDQVKEILGDALDESSDELGLEEEELISTTSKISFSQVFSAIFGTLVLGFAIFGIVTAGIKLHGYYEAKRDNSALVSYFERLVLPLAASDTPTFEDVNSLNRDVLLTAACWDVILSPSATYTVENGYYIFSYLELDAKINNLFGKGLSYTHGTVGDEELMFEYDEATGMYRIPCSPRTLAYYPKIDEIVPTDDGYVLTVSYRLPVSNWVSANTPAEKIMLCTVKQSDMGYTISSFAVKEIVNTSDL